MNTRPNPPRPARPSPHPHPSPPPKAPHDRTADRDRDRAAAAARRRTLAEWRRIDLTPAERARANNTRPAAALVPAVLQTLRLDARQAESEILKVWNHLLDPHIASHAQPVNLRRGTLFVAVDSSVWLTEIVRYRQREILERLQSSFGSQMIRRISFRLG